MQQRHFWVRMKSKPEKKKRVVIFLLPLLAIVVSYILLLPKKAGLVGEKVAPFLSNYFGFGRFSIPLLMIWYSWKVYKRRRNNRAYLDIMLSLSVILLLSAFFSIITKNGGGVIGRNIFDNLFIPLLGNPLSGISVVILTVCFISLLFNISLKEVWFFVRDSIIRDWSEWQKAREAAKSSRVVPQTVPAEGKSPETVLDKEELPQQKAYERAIKTVLKYEVYKFPSVELLADTAQLSKEYRLEETSAMADNLLKTLSNFNVSASLSDINVGPTITRIDITPGAGVKVQSIVSLSNDIALAMKAPTIRIMAPVPGKSVVGIEIPNPETKLVGLKEILITEDFQKSTSKLTIALGQTVDGKPYVTDLVPMPHLLIAGATGSGKSMCLHSIITSILYKARPDEVKFLMIDPKRLELSVYDGLPHLYDPRIPGEKVKVISNPKEAAKALQALVKVMEKRYEKYAQAMVRNIDGYNLLMEEKGGPKEYYIVVLIDELADLMLTVPKEVEDAIQRLAQMARAVGIHLVLATQRPSVDIITGVIKANLSARIAFQVLSKIDSRVILDTIGAESLLGKGDMLFLPTGAPKPVRLQGSYVSEKEIMAVVKFICKQGFSPEYDDLMVTGIREEKKSADETEQKYLLPALQLILERKRVSQDLLKAHFGSSARATDLLSLLEIKGFIYKPEGTNKWRIHFDKVEEYISAHRASV